jgi:hypothetical protein
MNAVCFFVGFQSTPLDGAEDRTTYPGKIEYTFIDPNGGPKRFWRITANRNFKMVSP